MRRRPVVGDYFRTQTNGVLSPFAGGKAGSKDPRAFVSGNVAGQQWDIAQQAEGRFQLENFPPPHVSERARPGSDLIPAIVRNIPTRMSFVRWVGTQSTAANAVLLVPRNPRRLAIQLSGMTFSIPAALQDVVAFSWGNPGPVNPTPPFPPGNILAPGNLLILTGDSVPIDDLYVWCPTLTGVQFTAFEGIEAPEGNQ